MQSYLDDEHDGGDAVKNKGAMPDVELCNLTALQHNTLAQVMGGYKGHIATENQLDSKCDTCTQQRAYTRHCCRHSLHAHDVIKE